ncbi:hypothetical protein O0L34_g18220 [Tuta absoluta]|nr:hypothetical protein O0L34_g18220 [Tuta absoluta]
MLKFVALCALLAAAVADPEPGALIAPYAYPYGYSSTYLAPATTTITKTASSYIANPYYSAYPYSSPYYPHFIKKRSAPFYAAGAFPYSYSYPNFYSAPVVTSSYAAPLVHSAPVVSTPVAYSAPAHFIKKRSAPLLAAPATYIAPASYAAAALPASYSYNYGAGPYFASPYYTTPIGYSHFIKKRSAPLLPYSAGYIAPAATSYSYSASAPLLASSYAAAPYYAASPYYAAPYAYGGFIKK